MVLLRHRRPEQGHDPVPGELVHRPPEPPHPLGQDRHEPAHDLRPHLGIEPLLQIHRPGHIGEQDGDVLLLSDGGNRWSRGWAGVALEGKEAPQWLQNMLVLLTGGAARRAHTCPSLAPQSGAELRRITVLMPAGRAGRSWSRATARRSTFAIPRSRAVVRACPSSFRACSASPGLTPG